MLRESVMLRDEIEVAFHAFQPGDATAVGRDEFRLWLTDQLHHRAGRSLLKCRCRWMRKPHTMEVSRVMTGEAEITTSMTNTGCPMSGLMASAPSNTTDRRDVPRDEG
jgi:hypothetical protein